MNRRIGGLIAAIILALLGAILVIAYAKGADSRAQAGQKVVEVYVVQDEIPAGTPTGDLGDRVAKEEIPRKVVASGAITSLKQIKGLVAGAVLVKGEQVVRARFTTPSAYQSTGNSVAVPTDLLTTTLSLAPERAVGGLLTPGSTVAVTASFDGEGNVPTQTGLLLQKVLVTNVQVADPSTADATDETNDPNRPGTSPQGALLVTLALPPDQVPRLLYAAEHGTIWLSTDPRTAPDGSGAPVVRPGIFR
ncbi:MAG: Flp pilus assembly protein CpaB [Actinomycetes bacterium]